MRILLVNPPALIWTRTELLDPPLGLAYIAAVLEQQGMEVECLDLSLCNDYGALLLQRLAEVQPHVVGVSSLTCTFGKALDILRRSKGADQTIKTVLGGPHVTSLGNHVAKYIDSSVDVVVFGEGEATFREIILWAHNKKRLADVPGVGFWYEGEFSVTPPREEIIRLDDLPFPARHLFPDNGFNQVHIMSSRGCPFNCVFCASPRIWRRIRYRSPSNFVNEIQHIVTNFGKKQIFIADDTFTYDSNRVSTICRMIMETDLNLEWACLTRADLVQVDTIRLMAKSGCKTVSIGCESGCQETLDKLNKRITIDDIRTSVQAVKSTGIGVRTSWVSGFPWETARSVRQTTHLIKELLPDEVVLYTPVPYPGTKLAENLEIYGGGKLTEQDWSCFHSGGSMPLITSESMPADLARTLLREAVDELRTLGYKLPNEATGNDRIVSTTLTPVHPFVFEGK